jgi:hypothetical protein
MDHFLGSRPLSAIAQLIDCLIVLQLHLGDGVGRGELVGHLVDLGLEGPPEFADDHGAVDLSFPEVARLHGRGRGEWPRSVRVHSLHSSVNCRVAVFGQSGTD